MITTINFINNTSITVSNEDLLEPVRFGANYIGLIYKTKEIYYPVSNIANIVRIL